MAGWQVVVRSSLDPSSEIRLVRCGDDPNERELDGLTADTYGYLEIRRPSRAPGTIHVHRVQLGRDDFRWLVEESSKLHSKGSVGHG